MAASSSHCEEALPVVERKTCQRLGGPSGMCASMLGIKLNVADVSAVASLQSHRHAWRSACATRLFIDSAGREPLLFCLGAGEPMAEAPPDSGAAAMGLVPVGGASSALLPETHLPLSAAATAAIDEALRAVLSGHGEVSQGVYVAAYNAVYAHCAAPTRAFQIGGEAVYRLIAERIDAYTRALEPAVTLEAFAAQMRTLHRSAQLLTHIFRYVERFYVRTAQNVFKQRVSASAESDGVIDTSSETPPVPLEQLFFQSLYCNYLAAAEPHVLALIFTAIEGCRQRFCQGPAELRTAVVLYSNVLVLAGREESVRRLHQRYMHGFIADTDFSMEIGRLLKKIYLEMYCATHIMGEKGMCREMVARLAERHDEVFEHVLGRLRRHENFRHIFKIIGMMDESGRARMRVGFQDIVRERLQRAESGEGDTANEEGGAAQAAALFERVRRVFESTTAQITANRMGGYDELLDEAVKGWLGELDLAARRRLLAGCLAETDGLLRAPLNDKACLYRRLMGCGEAQLSIIPAAHDVDGLANASAKPQPLPLPVQAQEPDLDACLPVPATVPPSINSLVPFQQAEATSATDAPLPPAPASAPAHDAEAAAVALPCLLPAPLIRLVTLIADDPFLEAFAAFCQRRLIDGCDPQAEAAVAEQLTEHLLPGSTARLANSIQTYCTGLSFRAGSCLVTVRKHTASFWKMQPFEAALPEELRRIRAQALEAVPLNYRERLAVNDRLSSVVLRLGRRVLRMSADMAGALWRVAGGEQRTAVLDRECPGWAEMAERLAAAGILGSDRLAQGECRIALGVGTEGARPSPDRTSPVISEAWLPDAHDFLDFFTQPAVEQAASPGIGTPQECAAVLEAAVCRALKRAKEMSLEQLCAELGESADVTVQAVEALCGRGYLSRDKDVITYLP